MDYIKRGIKVSLCFYGNSQTKYFMNKTSKFTIDGKPTFQNIEGFKMRIPPEKRSFILVPNYNCKNYKHIRSYKELLYHAIMDDNNAEKFGRNCVHIIEDYMKSYNINYIPEYSIEFEQCFYLNSQNDELRSQIEELENGLNS